MPKLATSKLAADLATKETGNFIADPMEELLADREKIHGDFHEKSTFIQHVKLAMRAQPNWEKLHPDQKEALDNVMQKIGRILHGDPMEEDHWRDIAGYASLPMRGPSGSVYCFSRS